MTHYALFVAGEWLCAVSVALFIGAGIEAICRRARR